MLWLWLVLVICFGALLVLFVCFAVCFGCSRDDCCFSCCGYLRLGFWFTGPVA